MRPPKRQSTPAGAPVGSPEQASGEVRVYAWAHPSQNAALSALAGALQEHGVTLEQFDPQGTHDRDRPLLVLLSDALIADASESIDATAATWRGPRIPIRPTNLTVRLPEGIAKVAAVFTDPGAPEQQADMIALAIRLPPDTRLAWLELQRRAERHRHHPDDRSALLGGAEQDRALETISERPPAVIPEMPGEIKRLIDDSAAAITRARRIRRTLAVTAAALLAVLLLVAVIQRRSALDAVGAAHAAQVRSEADRLSRLSAQELTSDPDLPILFARRAYQIDPEPQTREALRRALDAAPWHRSYRLPAAAASLASSPRSPYVAVPLADGTVVVIDTRDGHLTARIASPPRTTGGAVAAISPDARTLALAYNGGLIQLRSLTNPTKLLLSRRLARLGSAEAVSLAWLPGSRLLLSAWSRGPAVALDTATGAARTIVPAVPAAALAASPDGQLAALLTAGRLTILRTATMRVCSVQNEPGSGGAPQVLFDAAHPMILLIRAPGLPVQVPIPAACQPPGAAKPEEPGLPAASTANTASVLPDGSYAIGTVFGKLMVFTPPSSFPAAEFPAHTAAVTGVGNTAGGALVSVGADGWLRVWHLEDPALAYPAGVAPELPVDESLTATPAPATWRPLLAVTSAGEVVGAGPSTGTLWTAPAGDLAQPRERYFLALDASIRPATDGCHVLLITSAGGVQEDRCSHNQLIPAWHRRIPLQGSNVDNSAISPDGQLVGLAASGEIELTRTATATTAVVEELQSIAFDDADQLIGVQGNGTIITLTATGQVTRTPVDLHGESVSVAGVQPSGEQVLLVSSDGHVTLADRASGRVRERLTIPAGLSSAIDVRFSPDGKLAIILARDGYWVIDLPQWRLIASGANFSEAEVGSQPRDGAFLPGSDTLLILRADEGVQSITLAPWRFTDGRALLAATAVAVPRALVPGEAGQPQAIPSASE